MKDTLGRDQSRDVSQQMEDLAQRLRLLEPEAFDEFSRYFGPRLKSRFLRLDPEMSVSVAEDLACEQVTDIALKIHQYQAGNFRSWVYRAAKNAFIDRKRRERLRLQPLSELTVEPADEHTDEDTEEEGDAARQEAWQAVRDAMKQLSNEQQQIVRCYFFENNINKAEIDRQFGWPEGKSRVYFKRAIEHLKKILSQDARITEHERIGKLLAKEMAAETNGGKQRLYGKQTTTDLANI
ncbi:MAG: sigma-70 family RNA polymerase sigma factor [Acidobacteriota bacterium]|nr:sigma-70 family RNA polymerase sigma factor [Acidobacteriota bacterium]